MMLKVLSLLLIAQVAQAAFIGSIVYGEYEYAYFGSGDDNVNWCTAQASCPMIPFVPPDSTLAMAKTEEIENAIETLVSLDNYPGVWLGAIDFFAEGNWVWVDGTPLSQGYTNWNSAQPDNSRDEDCLEIYLNSSPDDWQWNDDNCGDGKGYVCQIPLTRAVSSDYSELTVHESGSMTGTFLEAKSECETIGARLVEIADERSKDVIMKKLKSSGHSKYWINMANSGSRCSILSQDGSEERDCDEKQFGFICETARPNMLKVSDEHPVVIESKELQIHCSSSGYPLPDVAWYKDEELMSDQSIGVASSTLFIKNAAQSDAGKYICLATNSINGRMSKVMGISDVSVASGEN